MHNDADRGVERGIFYSHGVLRRVGGRERESPLLGTIYIQDSSFFFAVAVVNVRDQKKRKPRLE
jgi:hypothetical protein